MTDAEEKAKKIMDRRCDRCGHPPKDLWTHRDGREIRLCRHHHNEHELNLIKYDWSHTTLVPEEWDAQGLVSAMPDLVEAE